MSPVCTRMLLPLLLALQCSVPSVSSAAACTAASSENCKRPPPAEHVLLQRSALSAKQQATSALAADSLDLGATAAEDCHTAVLGEACFTAVRWAKDFGVDLHPDWYPGLNSSSTFEDFQQLLHAGGHGAGHSGPANFAGCGAPCERTPTPAPTPAPTAAPTPEPACHTALTGERCFLDVQWAMQYGIRLHPSWYPNLTETSSFEEVQAVLHRKGHHDCPTPCEPEVLPTIAPGTCQRLVQGDSCYIAVSWAKQHGVRLHPDWYPGLTSTSSLTAFQALLARRNQGGCQPPCDEPEVTTTEAPAPVPSPPGNGTGNDNTTGKEPTRFMSWNVYYLHLADEARVRGVAEGIARVAPEIASIQEMWGEKPRILERLIQITGQAWAFAPGGDTETVWDGDILYRSDLWRHKSSGLRKYADRGLSWAVLERISDGMAVLVYGTHPWYTYPNDRPILETMKMATEDMKARQRDHPYPVVFMGDMNAHYELDSQRLLRTGWLSAYGLSWCAPITFEDSYAAIHPDAPNPPSGNWPVKIDFVYFQKSPIQMGRVVDARVWTDLPGGSDHFAVSGDIILNPVSKESVQNAKFLC